MPFPKGSIRSVIRKERNKKAKPNRAKGRKQGRYPAGPCLMIFHQNEGGWLDKPREVKRSDLKKTKVKKAE